MSLLPEGFSLNRRTFTQAFSALGLAVFARQLRGAPEVSSCLQDVLKEKEGAVAFPRDQVFFWVNGPRLLSRSHLAIFLAFKQGPENYLEKALLTTETAKVLAARYFPPQQLQAPACPPYLIFDNLDLRYIKKCFLILQWRENSRVKVYRFTLDAQDLQASRLAGTYLPLEMLADFSRTHQGKIISSFSFPAKMALKEHCSSAQLAAEERSCFLTNFANVAVKKKPHGNTFTCDFTFAYPDQDSQRYFRYFILTDPVGRLLALAKRPFQERATLGRITLASLTEEQWVKRWGVLSPAVADLSACPYLLAFAEHVQEGLFCTHLWLH